MRPQATEDVAPAAAITVDFRPHCIPALSVESLSDESTIVGVEEVGKVDQLEKQSMDMDTDSEKRLVRKLDLNLMPILFLPFLFTYFDRSNIGVASIAGMNEDLGIPPQGPEYNWLLTIFYIGFIIFQFFALMWKLVPPNIWAGCMIFGWGLFATLQAVVGSWAGMMAVRFLLGVFGAGFGPGVAYYLSFFYLRHELGLRIGIFQSAVPLAAALAGALAPAITSGPSQIASWRVLFLVEGIPCFLMAAGAFFILPKGSMEARFLNAQDRVVARARGTRQVGDNVFESKRIGNLDWCDLLSGLLDSKNYVTALMYFSTQVPFSSLPIFLPFIIDQMGFTTTAAEGLSAPPYLVAFIAVIITTLLADRFGQRGMMVIVTSLLAVAGFVILATCSGTAVRYVAIYMAAAGVYPANINILPWALNNQGSDTKRGAGIAILNMVGQCGPLLGTRIFPAAQGPFFREGMWICAGCMLLNAILAVVLRTVLHWANEKLDEVHGKREASIESASCGSCQGIENDGPEFRYVL